VIRAILAKEFALFHISVCNDFCRRSTGGLSKAEEVQSTMLAESTQSQSQPVRWISRLFWIAGIYGLVVLLPNYFLENRVGRDYPPAVTHPEYFYGFVGVGLAWQVAFLIIATDPRRYRPLILAGVLEKFSFAAAVAVLFPQGRVPTPLCVFAAIDLALGTLFLIAFARLRKS
jgi:hypothetical protein